MDAKNWYGVRCVFCDENHEIPLYEERITVWCEASFEIAVRNAEKDAREYATDIGTHYLGFAQAFLIGEPIEVGSEVFSLVRESGLSPDEYLNRFFDTGGERQRSLNES